MYNSSKQNKFSNSSILNMINLIYKGYQHLDNYVKIPYNKYAISLTQLLVRNSCIGGYKIVPEVKSIPSLNKMLLEIQLLYSQNMPAIQTVSFISLPSRRKYISFRMLKFHRCKNKQAISILNTNIGLLTGEEAINARIGGELVCIIN